MPQVLFLRFWKPRGVEGVRERYGLPSQVEEKEALPAVRVWMALLPYLIVVVIFGLVNLSAELKAWLKTVAIKIDIPALSSRLVTKDGTKVKDAVLLLHLALEPRNPADYFGSDRGHYLLPLQREGPLRVQVPLAIHRIRFGRLPYALVQF